jgi:hypothetical protein
LSFYKINPIDERERRKEENASVEEVEEPQSG